MIKFFPLIEMSGTPFGNPENGIFDQLGDKIFKSHGIVRTQSPSNCDILIAKRFPLSRRYLYSFILKHRVRKPILVWTHEPRYCRVFKKHIERSFLSPQVHIMSPYTGDIYLNNFSIYSHVIKGPIKPIQIDELIDFSKKKIVSIMTYRSNYEKQAFFKQGTDIDLVVYRQQLSLDGYGRGMVDIYGKRWPEEIAKGESKTDDWRDWHAAKMDLLKGYHFNICLENTSCDYYCTEKIWHPIIARSLPIYSSAGNKIYDDFPQDSFIDVAKFESSDELYDYIENMDKKEYCHRLNQCIHVHNNFLENDSFASQYEKMMMVTIDKISQIVRS